MKTKNLSIVYWVVTALFSIFFIGDGVAGMMRIEEGKTIMRELGYPEYILVILGLAKVMGAIAILQNRFVLLKEWAYAGFTFHFIGAMLSRYFAGHSAGLIISPLIFLAVMMISYLLWKKLLSVRETNAPSFQKQVTAQ